MLTPLVYYEEVEEGEMFTEHIDPLLFGAPVRCLGVSGRVVEVNEGGGSDKHLAIRSGR